MPKENLTVMIVDASARAHAADLVYVEGNNLQFRTDIGWRDIQREGKR